MILRKKKNTHRESARNKWREHKVVIQVGKKRKTWIDGIKVSGSTRSMLCAVQTTYSENTRQFILQHKNKQEKKVISHMYDCPPAFPVNLAINPERPDIQQLCQADFWLWVGPSALIGQQTRDGQRGHFHSAPVVCETDQRICSSKPNDIID